MWTAKIGYEKIIGRNFNAFTLPLHFQWDRVVYSEEKIICLFK